MRDGPGVAHSRIPMSRLLRLALAVLIIPVVAFAQKPQPTSPLELGTDPVAELSADGHTFARTGRTAMLVGMDAYVAPGSDEEMARAALAAHAAAVGLRAGSTADLAFVSAFTGQAGTVVRFRQTVGGVPVWGPETVVNLDLAKRAQLIANAYRPDVAVESVIPVVAAEAARATALAHLGATGVFQLDQTDLMVWPALDGARLAWIVRVVPAEPLGDWEVAIDARTGELLRVADRALYHGERGGEEPPTALPLVETHPLFQVDGTGFIFDPDPLTRAGVAYGTAGYVDGNDANTPQLQAARSSVTMRDITFDGTNYYLRGPWASIQEFESPNKGVFPSATPDWSFTRDADGFEAAMTYWHIDNYMRYVNVVTGSAAIPTAYTGGVRFDAHGLNGADNSHYLSGTDQLAFGEGCVDDNEDADVIIHELGHGLHDWLAAISQVDGLSEGFGDYVAASYTRSLSLLAPTAPSYNWIFKWDGHNVCWTGRTAAYTATYPTGGVPHTRGQHWSTSNMRIWNAIGGARTDKAVFEGVRMSNSGSTQPQVANMVMQAAANMGYTTAEISSMFSNYTQQGYTGLTMPVASTDGPSQASGVELTAASPNPFNGLTAFELVVDREQTVTVDVVDMLGRRVAVLFEGTVRPGLRYPFALEAAGLRAGVYVYRAVGETFSLSRRATLAR